MGPLCVLYAFNENYAPYACVSICSLLENNQVLPFSLYAVTEDVSEDSKNRLKELVSRYGRELHVVELSSLLPRMQKVGLPPYRGTQCANARLFFDTVVPKDTKRVLYLDCDTLICGDLTPLLEADLKGAPAAAVQDSLSARYKRSLGFAEDEPYFNSGVLLIDAVAWKEGKVPERVEKHCKEVCADYRNPDQDLLNLVLKGEILALPPKYNLQPHHSTFRDGTYRRVYKQSCYYTSSTLDAARNAPVILHAYRYLGDFPWHAKNRHPYTPEWNAYLAKTPWQDYQKKPARRGILFKLEKALYRLLPKGAFLRIFARINGRGAKQKNKK